MSLDRQRCEKCRYEKTRKKLQLSIEEVRNIFRENDCMLLESEYINYKTKMKYKCSCGDIAHASLSSIAQGCKCKKCGDLKVTGENHYNWNPDLTESERKLDRHKHENKKWIFDVLKKYNFTCIKCNAEKSGSLIAHHLDGFNWAKEKRTDVNNGVCLCDDCHLLFHSKFGYGNNTKKQFDLFMENKKY